MAVEPHVDGITQTTDLERFGVRERLDALFGMEKTEELLRTEMRALDGQRPIDLITAGRSDQVLEIVEAYEAVLASDRPFPEAA